MIDKTFFLNVSRKIAGKIDIPQHIEPDVLGGGIGNPRRGT